MQVPVEDDLRKSLSYGSTMSTRFFLSLAALVQAAGYLLGVPGWLSHTLYQGLSELLPLTVWAAMYGLVGVLGMWRVLDPQPHPRWAWITNTLTCFVWITGLVVRAKISPEVLLSTYSVMSLVSVWCLLRTEATYRDTRSA